MTLPRRNRIDLHCHTARSDGVLRPSDLLAAMRDWGIALASITDHDTLDGYRELRAAGEGDGYPRLLPGVEINGVATRCSRAMGSRAAHPRLRHGPG